MKASSARARSSGPGAARTSRGAYRPPSGATEAPTPRRWGPPLRLRLTPAAPGAAGACPCRLPWFPPASGAAVVAVAVAVAVAAAECPCPDARSLPWNRPRYPACCPPGSRRPWRRRPYLRHRGSEWSWCRSSPCWCRSPPRAWWAPGPWDSRSSWGRRRRSPGRSRQSAGCRPSGPPPGAGESRPSRPHAALGGADLGLGLDGVSAGRPRGGEARGPRPGSPRRGKHLPTGKTATGRARCPIPRHQRPGARRTSSPAALRVPLCQRVPARPRPLVSKRRPATIMNMWPSLA